MGKGKAKGWRPPAADDAKASMLLGSADHLTGDTIASPVQLRDEGRALPKGHPNYGDDWGKGGKGGKGRGGEGGDRQGTGANAIPVIAKPKGGWAPSLDAGRPAAEAGKPAAQGASPSKPPLLRSSAKAAPAAPVSAAEVKREPAEASPSSASTPSTREVAGAATPPAAAAAPTAPVRSDGKTEIERRREAMLLRERAAAGRQAQEVMAEGLRPPEDGEPEEAKRRREDSAAAGEEQPEAKRQREAAAPAPAAAGKPASGAMQQGLQGWAERVNGLAAGDADLAKRCREFVRKRILKAHASGDLHSVNWAEEPVPTAEELRPAGS